MLKLLPPCRLLAPALLTLGALVAPAHAQEAETKDKPFTVSGAAALVSDYRWRGYSLSNQTWATQATINLEHRSGLFIGTWASSISEIGGAFTCDPTSPPGGPPICAALAGSTDEVDVYGGWSGTLGPVDVTGGLMAYIYPGADGFNYFEFYGTVGYTIGTVSLTGGLNWAPDQGNLAGSNRYLFGAASWAIPKTPVTLKATLGSERGSVVLDKTGERTSKFDWLIGADVSGDFIGLSPITLGFGYSSNNLPDRQGVNAYAEGGFYFSLSAGF
jgi:uncharacterized protein (TIGR02001 family)